MNLRKLGFALVAVLALGSVIASSALANPAIQTAGYWYKSGTKLTTGVQEAITCAASGSFVFESSVTNVLGTTPVKISATGLSCPGGKIFNEGSKAKGVGRLKLTGASFIEPSCGEITGGVIETEALRMQVWMEEGSPSKAFLHFTPASGTKLTEIIIKGSTCALDEAFPLTGDIFAELTSATSVSVVSQGLKFSGTINSGAGGSLLLDDVGYPPPSHSATLTGQAGFGLTSGAQLMVQES